MCLALDAKVQLWLITDQSQAAQLKEAQGQGPVARLRQAGQGGQRQVKQGRVFVSFFDEAVDQLGQVISLAGSFQVFA